MPKIYTDFGIYAIRNKCNKNLYIGSTIQSFGTRWEQHRYRLKKEIHSNCYLQNAWNKYGKDNFEFIMLWITHDKNLMALRIIETLYIHNLCPAYNMELYPCLGPFYKRPVSEQTRKKLREVQLGKTVSEKTRQKISDSMRGRVLSEEHRKNLSDSAKKRKPKKWTETSKKKLSMSISGEKHAGSKLVTSEVIAIKEKYASGDTTQKELAEYYGVSKYAIYAILAGKSWKHLSKGNA